jgi:hypothetical protein
MKLKNKPGLGFLTSIKNHLSRQLTTKSSKHEYINLCLASVPAQTPGGRGR